MTKNLLLGAALATTFLAAGVVVGRQMGPMDSAAPVTLARTVSHDAGGNADLAVRVARLDESVQVLRQEQANLGKRLQPAAEVMSFLNKRAPSLKTARKRANQMAAIATLRNITSAQAQFQASGAADQDQDGTGEYAGFAEMSGDVPGRMRTALVPPVLSGAFRTLTAHGETMRSGYHYRVYLPGKSGTGLGEPARGFTQEGGVDVDLAETTWCCYAWPKDNAAADTRVLFVNQMGDILETSDSRYVGTGQGPKPDAAFREAGTIIGPVAIGTKGQDGNTWKRVK